MVSSRGCAQTLSRGLVDKASEAEVKSVDLIHAGLRTHLEPQRPREGSKPS